MKVTADDIAQLLACSPPRQVPEHVTRVAQDGRGPRTRVLMGFGFGVAGLFIVGMIFPWRWIDELRLKGDGAGQATGVIQWVREANLTVKGKVKAGKPKSERARGLRKMNDRIGRFQLKGGKSRKRDLKRIESLLDQLGKVAERW